MTSTFADRLQNSAIPGYGTKTPVLCASTGNVTLTGASSTAFDGMTPSSGDRILVWQQNSTHQNGVYVHPGSTVGTWTRDADFDGNTDVVTGTLIPIAKGMLYAGKVGQVTSTGSGSNGRHAISTNSSTSDAITLQMLQPFGSTAAIQSTATYYDTALFVAASSDTTAQFRFSATGITSGQTRIITVPDGNLVLVGSSNAQTLSNKSLTDNVTSFVSNINSTLNFKFSATGVTSTDQATAIMPGSTSAFTLSGTTLAQTLQSKTISGANNTLTVRASADVTGNFGTTNFNSGTNASTATFLRGDMTWTSQPSSNAGTLTAVNASSGIGGGLITSSGDIFLDVASLTELSTGGSTKIFIPVYATSSTGAAIWKMRPDDFPFTTALRRAVMQFSGGGTNLTAGATLFFGSGLASGIESAILVPVPFAGTVKNLVVQASAAPGSGQTFVATVRHSSVDTTVTATISGSSASNALDTTNSFTVVQGDAIDIKIVASGSATTAFFAISLEVDAS